MDPCLDLNLKFYSKDKSWYVCHVESGLKYSIAINGKVNTFYDWVGYPDFSPDNKRFAYKARNGNEWFVVTGNKGGTQKKGESFDEIEAIIWNVDVLLTNFFVFGPSGTLVYNARNGENWYVVYDDKVSPAYERARPVIFSSDGIKMSYKAKRQDKWFVVVGDKEGKPYDWVGFPMWSPDSKQVSYKAKQGDKSFVVVGDKEGKPYDWVGFPMWSPDSKQVSYKAKQGDKSFVVVGDKEGKPYDEVVSISPNSNYRDFDLIQFKSKLGEVVYAARNNKEWNVVIGEKEGKQYKEITVDSKFSPDKIVYRGRIGDERFIIREDQDGTMVERKIDLNFTQSYEVPKQTFIVSKNIPKGSSEYAQATIRQFERASVVMRRLASKTETRLDKILEISGREDLDFRTALAEVRRTIHMADENVKLAKEAFQDNPENKKKVEEYLVLCKKELVSAHRKFVELIKEIKNRKSDL